MNVASSSIPDLRASGARTSKILLGVGVLVLVGLIVGALVILKTGDNPGKAACDHIETLAAKETGKRWDRFVGALERTVENRVYNSKERKYVNITGDSRVERCEHSFEVIRDTISYSAYEKLSACVQKATSFREGSNCFDDF